MRSALELPYMYLTTRNRLPKGQRYRVCRLKILCVFWKQHDFDLFDILIPMSAKKILPMLPLGPSYFNTPLSPPNKMAKLMPI